MILYIPSNRKWEIKGMPVTKVDSRNFIEKANAVVRDYGTLGRYVCCDFIIYKVNQEEFVRLGGRDK